MKPSTENFNNYEMSEQLINFKPTEYKKATLMLKWSAFLFHLKAEFSLIDVITRCLGLSLIIFFHIWQKVLENSDCKP